MIICLEWEAITQGGSWLVKVLHDQLHGPADLCLKYRRQTEAGQKQLQPQLRRLPGRQAPGARPTQPDLLPFLWAWEGSGHPSGACGPGEGAGA